ncbi:MAG TPA: CidA/LrgA family protein [Magnetospirillum sp.]|nr:CidA/LrgA family protein [Magnetospirillum sp.]
MLSYITVLLACQLAGEVIARLSGIPIPGPVVGMVLLFIGLLIRRGVPEGLEKVGNTLLSHLSLLFIPAGVGIMVHLRLIASEWLPITVALVVSTVLTLAVTGLVMQWLTPKGRRG